MGKTISSEKKKWLLLQLPYLILLSVTFAINMPSAHADGLVQWKEEDIWTLRIQGHAPRYGYTEASAQWDWKNILTMGPYKTTSWLTHIVVLRPGYGECCADFRLCRWRYELWQKGHDIWGQPLYEMYWFIKTALSYATCIDIHSTDMTTCEDDLESITYNGYQSTKFESRYKTQDYRRDNPSDSNVSEGVSVGVGDSWCVGLDVEVVVGGLRCVGGLQVYNTRSTTFTYMYTFSPHTKYSIDWLGDRSKEKGWTFKYLGSC